MTLGEIEQQTGVPVAELVSHLNLPPDTAPTARIGQLARAHGLTLAEVRQVIATYGKAGPASAE
jgi:hypothetical protein